MKCGSSGCAWGWAEHQRYDVGVGPGLVRVGVEMCGQSNSLCMLHVYDARCLWGFFICLVVDVVILFVDVVILFVDVCRYADLWQATTQRTQAYPCPPSPPSQPLTFAPDICVAHFFLMPALEWRVTFHSCVQVCRLVAGDRRQRSDYHSSYHHTNASAL